MELERIKFWSLRIFDISKFYRANTDGNFYDLTLEFYDFVDSERIKVKEEKNGKIFIEMPKMKKESWPRLTKENDGNRIHASIGKIE